MPRNVRNFWLEIGCDGYKSPIKIGPRDEKGGFLESIWYRDRGEVRGPVTIQGKATDKGLVLTIHYPGYEILFQKVSQR